MKPGDLVSISTWSSDKLTAWAADITVFDFIDHDEVMLLLSRQPTWLRNASEPDSFKFCSVLFKGRIVNVEFSKLVAV